MKLTIDITYIPGSSKDRQDFIDDIAFVCEDYEAEMIVDSTS